jgi:hypothetical protein
LRLILAAPFEFGLPREQVVAIVFWKVALISDVQHDGHLAAIAATMVGLLSSNAQ